jgi:outer membrane protein assembly factor BamB
VAAFASAGCNVPPARSPWPSFRGPQASGIADGQNPPLEWDARSGHNVQWKVEIPGLGHSSPVVWGDRVFLTTAISDDPDFIFRTGMDPAIDRRTDRSRQLWRLYAFDRHSGEEVWMREPLSGLPSVWRHPKNSYATATPATDGEHVVVLLSTGNLYGYDFDGEPLWSVDLGPINAGASYDATYSFGAASSPIIWQELAIVQVDQQESSFIAAFDVDTGEEVWRTERDIISSFSTPTIHVGAERVELVANGAESMRGYDPRTGEELWRLSSRPVDRPSPPSEPWLWATIATPVSYEDLVYVYTVYRRDHPLFAIREGANGDISLRSNESSNAHVAWRLRRDGPFLSTPLAYRGLLYIVSPTGILNVFDVDSGERVYRRRIGDRGGAYSSSPVAADGRIYVAGEDGDVFVLAAGPEYELLATNSMNEVCLATPAISEGQIFIRTRRHLFALRGQPVTPDP